MHSQPDSDPGLPKTRNGLALTIYQRIYAERDCLFFMADPDAHKLPARWAAMQWIAVVLALGAVLVVEVSSRSLRLSAADVVPTWAVLTVGLVLGLAVGRIITRGEDVYSLAPDLLARYKTPRERVKTWSIGLGLPVLLGLAAMLMRF